MYIVGVHNDGLLNEAVQQIIQLCVYMSFHILKFFWPQSSQLEREHFQKVNCNASGSWE